jgi:hypothetical protein
MQDKITGHWPVIFCVSRSGFSRVVFLWVCLFRQSRMNSLLQGLGIRASMNMINMTAGAASAAMVYFAGLRTPAIANKFAPAPG